jgi:hypothetical protein
LLSLPRFTLNPCAPGEWFRGAAQTYYGCAADEQKNIFVCSSVVELWQLCQISEMNQAKMNLLLVCSTRSDQHPDEWYLAEFWSRFETVYLGFPNSVKGDRQAVKLNEMIAGATPTTAVRRVLPPAEGVDNTSAASASAPSSWNELCLRLVNKQIPLAGELADAFSLTELLEKSRPLGAQINFAGQELFSSAGRFAYQPIDPTRSFYQGHLCYPVRTMVNVAEKYRDENGARLSQLTSRLETVLVRSDRTLQTIASVPAPRGTPLAERVWRLSDGTLLESPPVASPYATWSWRSIEKFLDNTAKTRSLAQILLDVKSYLQEAVWLPFAPDYDLLAFLVPVTFAQAIFRSVPLVLVTGEPGSGKSLLGRAMCRLCANSALVGQTSAAAIARLVHETRGFVVLDDLETIIRGGSRAGTAALSGQSSVFTDLVQLLKLSYNQETGVKIWSDAKNGLRTEKLNFYGVKMINNTRGADPILKSRALRIFIRQIPAGVLPRFRCQSQWSNVALARLRDELYTWTFENAPLIAQTYERLFPFSSDRAEEIFAPLRVFSELSRNFEGEDALMPKLLEESLILQNAVREPFDFEKILRQAVREVVSESGTAFLAPSHVAESIKRLLTRESAVSARESEDLLKKYLDPAWLGRQLRNLGYIETNAAPLRLPEKGKSLRFYPLKKNLFKEILSSCL